MDLTVTYIYRQEDIYKYVTMEIKGQNMLLLIYLYQEGVVSY